MSATKAKRPKHAKPAPSNSEEAPPAKSDAVTPTSGQPKAHKAKKQTRDKLKALSALDAAAKVLAEMNEPMTTKQMIEAMAEKGYWKSPGGKTPHATLYSAILRELTVKGKDARFKKTERGKFAAKS